MFERLIRFSIAQRLLILLGAVGVAMAGIYSYQRLPIDAVPDITNVQVQINTQAPGYSPLEAEQRVTFPIEIVMAGLPNLQQTRSLSRYGLSQVTVIFDEGTDIFFARQLVNERISQARDKLPPGLTPEMGPIATGLGEIYLWTVEADKEARKLARLFVSFHCPQIDLAQASRDRSHFWGQSGGQLVARLRDTLIDQLSREKNIGTFIKDHRHLRETIAR